MAEERTIYLRTSRERVEEIAGTIPAILAGRSPDRFDIARGLRLRIALVILSKILQAFDVKADGGTDEAGDSWRDLSREYKAYGRRFGKGEQSQLTRAAGLDPRKNRFAPGGNKGLLTKEQLERWKKLFGVHYHRLLLSLSDREAKIRAAQIAWAKIKEEGAKTKLEVFGSRKVQILRDTGVLRNSLSPGFMASPSGAKGQVLDVTKPGEVIIGTNVEYAEYHHGPGKNQRRLWPEPSRWPDSWWEAVEGAAERGLFEATVMLLQGDAA